MKHSIGALNLNKFLTIAGGKISCRRCTAISKRSGQQCGAPALRISKTQKCRIHGGKSTGPKTEAGIQRIRESNITSGNETKTAREDRSKKNLWFAQAEDVMQVLEMTTSPRNRGRKPNGYTKIKTLDDVKEWAANDILHPIRASIKD
jgi:hypothetical protein